MERFSHFIDFNSHDLAADESFQSYFFRHNQEDILFWEKFISLHPSKQAEINEAIKILSLLRFKRTRSFPRIKESQLTRLLSFIQGSEKGRGNIFLAAEASREFKPLWSGMFDRRWSRMAASLAGFLILCGAAFFFLDLVSNDRTITYQTRYGENASFILPDSSTVILNGNTTLTLKGNWSNKIMREVWLDGEAFFDVKNKGISKDARFIVHTPGMDVEVLGTRFNVFNRDDRASVVLNSGKVKVNIASDRDTSSVLMMPDEAIEFLRKDHSITKKQVKAEILTSWRNKVWVFENTPLYKISEMIEYTFGVKVIFNTDVDSSEELAGTIPSENLEVLLTVLAKSSNLLITRHEDQIIIQKDLGSIKN
ncbi:MAG: FecR domain-containing protein [Cyclobacteriaceae bacterium]